MIECDASVTVPWVAAAVGALNGHVHGGRSEALRFRGKRERLILSRGPVENSTIERLNLNGAGASGEVAGITNAGGIVVAVTAVAIGVIALGSGDDQYRDCSGIIFSRNAGGVHTAVIPGFCGVYIIYSGLRWGCESRAFIEVPVSGGAAQTKVHDAVETHIKLGDAAGACGVVVHD